MIWVHISITQRLIPLFKPISNKVTKNNVFTQNFLRPPKIRSKAEEGPRLLVRTKKGSVERIE